MRLWAEIDSTNTLGIVKTIHAMPDKCEPEFNPNSGKYWIETTKEVPAPAAYWKYNLETQEWSPADPRYINPIGSKEFFLRFTGNERETLVASVHNKVKQFLLWMQMTGDVNLDDSDVQNAVNWFESQGLIGVGRAAVILTIEEQ